MPAPTSRPPRHTEARALASRLSALAGLLANHRTPVHVRADAEKQARGLVNGIGAYYRLGMPFGDTGVAFSVWYLYGQFTSSN